MTEDEQYGLDCAVGAERARVARLEGLVRELMDALETCSRRWPEECCDVIGCPMHDGQICRVYSGEQQKAVRDMGIEVD